MLAPMIEDAFELKEKSSAQKELLRWSAEQRSAASEGERPAKQPVRRFSGVQSGSGSSHESPGATATAKQTALGPQSNGAAAGHENQSDVGDGDAERVEDNQLSASELRMRYQGDASISFSHAGDNGTTSPRHIGGHTQAARAEDGTAQEAPPPSQPIQADEASMQDKVILQQRMQLEQLRRDKVAAEQEREALRQQMVSMQGFSKAGIASTSGLASNNDALSSRTLGSRLAAAGDGLDQTLHPLLPTSQKSTGPVGWRRTLALALIILTMLWLSARMFARVQDDGIADDVSWDLEIDHSEMQRLAAALAADKARIALQGAGGSGNRTLHRDLAAVKDILNDLHKKSLKNHGHAAAQELLRRDNQRLEAQVINRGMSADFSLNLKNSHNRTADTQAQLKQLRSEISALRGQETTSSKPESNASTSAASNAHGGTAIDKARLPQHHQDLLAEALREQQLEHAGQSPHQTIENEVLNAPGGTARGRGSDGKEALFLKGQARLNVKRGSSRNAADGDQARRERKPFRAATKE